MRVILTLRNSIVDPGRSPIMGEEIIPKQYFRMFFSGWNK
jgi:hypothetical protein